MIVHTFNSRSLLFVTYHLLSLPLSSQSRIVHLIYFKIGRTLLRSQWSTESNWMQITEHTDANFNFVLSKMREWHWVRTLALSAFLQTIWTKINMGAYGGWWCSCCLKAHTAKSISVFAFIIACLRQAQHLLMIWIMCVIENSGISIQMNRNVLKKFPFLYTLAMMSPTLAFATHTQYNLWNGPNISWNVNHDCLSTSMKLLKSFHCYYYEVADMKQWVLTRRTGKTWNK